MLHLIIEWSHPKGRRSWRKWVELSVGLEHGLLIPRIQAPLKEWAKLGTNKINNLIGSMPGRLSTIIAAERGVIRN